MMSAGSTMSPCAPALPVIPEQRTISCNVSGMEREFIAMLSFLMPSASKCGRCVDPQHPRFFASGIPPAMRRGAFKIQTVAGLQPVMFSFVKPDFKISAKHVQKFLPFVRVGFAAAAAGLDAEEVRFHCRVAPGQQFHAHIDCGSTNLYSRRANQTRIVPGRFE